MNFFQISNNEFPEEMKSLFSREEQNEAKIEEAILQMRQNIRTNGFSAISEYTKELDHFDLTEENIHVHRDEIDQLAAKIDPEINAALEVAVKRIKAFHSKQVENSFEYKDSEGNRMGQKTIPLDSVAVYVPGGTALYPSTFYMTVIPALIAGVKRIVVITPPRTFIESPEVARLIQILDIKEIYRGAGAALVLGAAYGIGIPKVDKIVGPGNSFVAKAKQIAFGTIDIDMFAGPSDILVVADTTDPKDIPLIAADLLSQAEHGPAGENQTVLVGCNKEFLRAVETEVYKQAEILPNKEAILASLKRRGLILECRDMDHCIETANKIAPEHLELFSADPYPLLEKVRHAGSVFLGKNTPESVGDYLGGPNHVLPTEGSTRFFSPLGVYDFQKKLNWCEFNRSSLEKYRDTITTIARSEDLEAHARAVEVRFE